MFDVFLERPHDTTPEGRERLARALAQHYRIDPDVFRKPIVSGRRLRVKAKVDDRAARALARELEGFGAVVSITAHAETGRPSKAVETVPSSATKAVEAVPSSAMKAVETTPSSEMNFTLTTLDGDVDEAGPMPSLSVATPAGPPPPKAPAPAPRATSSPHAAASSPPVRRAQDMFAPPDDSEQPLELQLMPSKQGTVARESAAMPARESGALPARPPSAAQAAVVEEAPPPPPAPERRRLEIDLSSIIERARNDPRGRFVAGLALGLLVGFLPAQLYASLAEDKLDEIGAQLAKEPAPQTEAEYQLMLQQFDLAERRSERVKTRIMVVTGALWLLAGAGATYGYWRLTSR